MKNWSEKIKAYALKNAIEHEGRAVEGSVISSLFHEGLNKEDVKKIISEVKKTISEVNKLKIEEQEKEFSKLERLTDKRKEREGLPPLPGAKKGKVIMRFAPSPSGPLHVGHAYTGSFSYIYVQKYGGTFYIRIEDTNPENIYKPAYKMIQEEAKWLFENKVKVLIQSERIPIYYKYAERLIKTGNAYVCVCESEKFKELITSKKTCPCRKSSIKENQEKWKKMLSKTGNSFKEGEAVLRFKSDVKHKNPAMRDFPLARINETSHPLQGKKYRVWPLMNLAVSADDIELKMTHIIRAKEHRDNAERQKLIFKALKKKFSWTAFLGRLHFKDFHLSSTRMRKSIEAGEFKAWDDPRLPTIAALKKKYKPESFWKFSEQVGLSEVDKIMEKKEYFRLLDEFNK